MAENLGGILDLERQVLSMAMIGREQDRDLLDAAELAPEDFLGPEDHAERHHRRIWQAILNAAQDGDIQKVDLSVVQRILTEKGELDGLTGSTIDGTICEGLDYLQSVAMEAESAANLGHHMAELRRGAVGRRLARAVTKAGGELNAAGVDPFQVMADLGERIEALRSTARSSTWGQSIGDLIPGAFQTFQSRMDAGARVPWPADWRTLADIYRGGLLPGLHILVGNTGGGKTQLALQLALSAARSGHAVGYLALEADAGCPDLVARFTSTLMQERAQVGRPMLGNWSDMYTGLRRDGAGGWQPVDAKALAQAEAVARQDLACLPIYPVSLVPANTNAAGIVDAIRAFRRSVKADPQKPALVVLDYLQRVRGRSGDDLRAAIGDLSQHLRHVATRENAAILALSSTARANYPQLVIDMDPPAPGKKPPKRPDVRGLVGLGKESGEIEYDADSVLVLAREIVQESSRALVGAAKMRTGGEAWAEDMAFESGAWRGIGVAATPKHNGGGAW